jgi:PTH1 family peptidyl-tRNA hydrolase
MLLSCLGNKGKTYEKTRHNIGWMFADHLISSCITPPVFNTKFHSRYAQITGEFPVKVLVQLPETMMNNSGLSVREISSFYGLEASRIIAVHDDLETPFGKVTLQRAGGHGGHNGVRSIMKELGTHDFCRLKLGIGRPVGKQQVHSYVLSRFTADQEISLERMFDHALMLIRQWLADTSQQLPLTRTLD